LAERKRATQAGWHRLWRRPVRTPADATAFVQALGFCTWGPIDGLAFPNVAEAMGRTAWTVMDVTWGWKDDVHMQRKAHYGKIIKGQPSFITPDFLPDFVAAVGGRGLQVERDPSRLYAEGRLPRNAHVIFEHLRSSGRASSGELRRIAGSDGFDRALVELQRRFVICKVDLAGRTRGTYAYVWDLGERFWPDAYAEAAGTSPGAARSRIRGRLREFGLEPDPALESRLFLWRAL